LRENGKFVSRPVTLASSDGQLVQHAVGVSSHLGSGMQGLTPKATPRRPAPGPIAVIGHASLSVGSRALAAPLHLVQALISTVSVNAPAPADPATVVRPRPAPPAARPLDHLAPVAARARVAQARRAPLDRILSSRAFWQALTLLGAVLLALVAWIAFSPDALSFLGPSARAPASTASSGVFVPTLQRVARDTSAPMPVATAPKASAQTVPAANGGEDAQHSRAGTAP
jgi:hypothetical protein